MCAVLDNNQHQIACVPDIMNVFIFSSLAVIMSLWPPLTQI